MFIIILKNKEENNIAYRSWGSNWKYKRTLISSVSANSRTTSFFWINIYFVKVVETLLHTTIFVNYCLVSWHLLTPQNIRDIIITISYIFHAFNEIISYPRIIPISDSINSIICYNYDNFWHVLVPMSVKISFLSVLCICIYILWMHII